MLASSSTINVDVTNRSYPVAFLWFMAPLVVLGDNDVVHTHSGGDCSVYKVMFSTSSRDYVPDLDLETKFSLISTLKGWITPSPNHFRLFELNWIEFSQVISAIKLRMIPNALKMGITFFENLFFGSDTFCINVSEIELLNFTIQTVLKYAFNFCA